MIKKSLLINGIGDNKETNKYYDKWSSTYDKTLSDWNYKAPTKASLILKSNIDFNPKNMLDLGCGTGLFGEKVLHYFPNILIDGIDSSSKILIESKRKNIYKKLICSSFDNKISFKKKYDIVSCIGAMTYTKDPKKLLLKVYKKTKVGRFFIFTHRVDLWKKQKFSKLLLDLSTKWKVVVVSRPILYLPNNPDFNKKIKIKVALLRKC